MLDQADIGTGDNRKVTKLVFSGIELAPNATVTLWQTQQLLDENVDSDDVGHNLAWWVALSQQPCLLLASYCRPSVRSRLRDPSYSRLSRLQCLRGHFLLQAIPLSREFAGLIDHHTDARARAHLHIHCQHLFLIVHDHDRWHYHCAGPGFVSSLARSTS